KVRELQDKGSRSQVMKTSAETAREMGEYILQTGFSPYWTSSPDTNDPCGCFRHAMFHEYLSIASFPVIDKLAEITGVDQRLDAKDLIAAGWTEGCAEDAAAACFIAADLLS